MPGAHVNQVTEILVDALERLPEQRLKWARCGGDLGGEDVGLEDHIVASRQFAMVLQVRRCRFHCPRMTTFAA